MGDIIAYTLVVAVLAAAWYTGSWAYKMQSESQVGLTGQGVIMTDQSGATGGKKSKHNRKHINRKSKRK